MKRYDYIIIGTGAGGSTIAYKLAKTGKSILILEKGDFLPEEASHGNSKAFVVDGEYQTNDKCLNTEDNELGSMTHYHTGRDSKMYGAALVRMSASDFEEVKHFGGNSPSWPIEYSELEPYYAKAEKLYHIKGETGVNTTNQTLSSNGKRAALSLEPRMQEIFSTFHRHGLHPAPLAIGVKLPKNEKIKNSELDLSMFDGYPDITESIADVHIIGLIKALKHKNVRLKTNREAIQLLTDDSGEKVTEVICKTAKGKEEIYTGDTIIVSCGAIDSAALLLKSKSELHQEGLANGSGLVGRNLMLHNNGTVVAISEKANDSEFQSAYIISDFYHKSDDSKYPLGSIQFIDKTDPDTLKNELMEIKTNDKWDIENVADHSIEFFITSEDLPRLNNRVVVTDTNQIKLEYSQNNLEAYTRLRKKLIGLLDYIDCEEGYCKDTTYAGFSLNICGVSHQNGTCKFGVDPETSVLDVNCKAHELENLYVVDSSFFCSSAAVNPSLTIIANALRVGDHLLKQQKNK